MGFPPPFYGNKKGQAAMTKTAIVKGIARWYGKNVVPRIPPFSMAKVAHATVVLMAERNPDMVETFLMNVLAPGVGAMLQTLGAAASDDALFDLAAKSLRDAVAQEPIRFATPGTNGLDMKPADVELLIGEIKTAQTEIDNAAALAKANGGQ